MPLWGEPVRSAHHLELRGTVQENVVVAGHQGKALGRGLRDQNPIKGIFMNGRQSVNSRYMFPAQRQGGGDELLKRRPSRSLQW
jgi:hypothetical protein